LERYHQKKQARHEKLAGFAFSTHEKDTRETADEIIASLGWLDPR